MIYSFCRRLNQRRSGYSKYRQQRGVVIWVALGILILMSLVGIAMLRQMGSGLGIAGNIAFKQAATAAADFGTETGRELFLSLSSPNNDDPDHAYIATWGTTANPADISFWTNSQTTSDGMGNQIEYIVHRLCRASGPSDAVEQNCSGDPTTSPSRGGASNFTTTTIQPYYRITTKSTGIRNTVSYTQVIAR